MVPTAIFWPMIAHALLVFCLYGLLAVRRKAAVQAGADADGFRENRSEPAASLGARNCLANQFELPVLFHVACLALHATAGVNFLTVALAWLFVLARYGHAAAHVGANHVPTRFAFFFSSLVGALLLWVWLALHIAGVV